MKHWLVEPGACGFHSWHHLSFWSRGTALAMALHPYGMNTAQDTEGGIGTMKRCGRKLQELTNQHPNCLCPEHYRHSNGGLMKSMKSVLEVFVIKLNEAGYNILKKNFSHGKHCSQWDIKKQLTCQLKVTEMLSEQWLHSLMLQWFRVLDALGHPLNLY